MGNHGEFGKAMRHSLEENYGVPYETWCSHFLQNAFPEITASTGEFARALGCPLSRVGRWRRHGRVWRMVIAYMGAHLHFREGLGYQIYLLIEIALFGEIKISHKELGMALRNLETVAYVRNFKMTSNSTVIRFISYFRSTTST